MTASVAYLENALTPQHRRVELVEACTIRSLAPQWDTPYVAFLDGQPVLRADWEVVLEDEHSLLFIDVNAIPQGGGGDSDPVRTIAMIAVITFAPQLAASALFGSSFMAAAALGSAGFAAFNFGAVLVGMALLNAVMPAPKPTSNQQASSAASPSPTYNLAAQGNSARLESAIPEHFGSLRCYPDLAAMPYTEYLSNEQYLYQLLCVGRGKYTISDLQIEDTPIGNFQEVTYQIVQPGQPVTLFPASVLSSVEVAGQELTNSGYIGPFTLAPAGTTTNGIAFDLVMPRGIYFANDNGSLGTLQITVSTEACAIDNNGNPTGSWFTLAGSTQYSPWGDWTLESGPSGTPLVAPTSTPTTEYQARESTTKFGREDPPISTYYVYKRTRTDYGGAEVYTGNTTTPQRWSLFYPVAPGRYMVRVKRQDAKNTSTRAGHEIVWSGARAYLQSPATYGDVTLVAIKMRASNNLSQQGSRKINLMATRHLPAWNGFTWTEPQPTRSIAWAIAYVCKECGLKDTQIDIPTLAQLNATWESRGDYLDARFDNFLGFWETVQKIGQAGRAKPYMQGGVMRVARDQASTIPVAMFTMRNIVKNSFSVKYMMPTEETADSVDVSYFDRTTWKPSSVRSTLTGSTALKPAKVTLFGVTDRAQAHREGLYIAATNRYRRRMIKFSTEYEGLIPSFGDLISIQHDMPGWGQSGEVVAWDQYTNTLTVNEPLTFKVGQNHYVYLRARDGHPVGPYLCTAGADAYKLVLATAPEITPYIGRNEERTHYSFGWAETYRQPARVLSVRPGGGTQVEITCVNEDNSVHTADTGVIAPALITSSLSGFRANPIFNGLRVAPTGNQRHLVQASWDLSQWADSYIVEQAGDDGNWAPVGETSHNNISFIALGDPNTKVRAAAVGFSKGSWMQVTYTMPALENVTNLSITATSTGMLVKWDKAFDIDYELTELRAGASWDTGTLITRKNSTTHLMGFQPAGTLTVWAKHFDLYKKQSDTAVSATLLVTAPAAPSAFNYSLSDSFEVLEWTIPTSQVGIDVYEIRYGATWALVSEGGSGIFVDKPKSTSFRRRVDYTGARRYWIAAIDVAGNVGTPRSVDVSIAAPGEVTGTRVEVVDNNALIFWAPPVTGSLPVDRYEVRKGATFASGTVLGSNGNSTFTTVFEQVAGTYQYWIAAVDSAGFAGTPKSVSALINQPPDYVLRNDYNSDFTLGTRTNVALANGTLVAPVNTAETWQQHYVNNGFTTPQSQISAGLPIYIEPSLASGSYVEVKDYGSTLPATTITVTLNSTLLAGTVTATCQIEYNNTNGTTGPWTAAPVGATSVLATNFRWVRVTYTFAGAAGANLIQVNAMNIKLSVKQRTDSGTGTITNATTGVVVPFNYPFIDCDTPVVQPGGTTPLIAVVDFADVPNPTSFTVYLYTLAGVKTTGSFSWSVRGY